MIEDNGLGIESNFQKGNEYLPASTEGDLMSFDNNRLVHFDLKRDEPALDFVLGKLKKAGFKTWIVGGAVRDLLRGIRPSEFDLVTEASPSDVIRLFSKTVPVGLAFGVVVVKEGGKTFEVAQLRQDGPYRDGRHPVRTERGTLNSDAHRRDFTVNALYFDPWTRQVLDPTGLGLSDLRARCLRGIGDPRERFLEDHLRSLRLIRFASQLNFYIEPRTAQAANESWGNLKTLPWERIWPELEKLALGEGVIQFIRRYSLLLKGAWENLFNTYRYCEGLRVSLLSYQRGSITDGFFAWLLLALSFLEDPLWNSFLREVGEKSLTRGQKSWIASFLRYLEVVSSVWDDRHWELFMNHRFREVAWVLLPDDHPLRFFLENWREHGFPNPSIQARDLLERGFTPGAELGRLLKKCYLIQLRNLDLSREQLLKLIPFLIQSQTDL